MTVVSISLTRDLLNRLDEFREARGYSSRSEAIRDGLRDLLTEYELERIKDEGKVTATITVISRHDRRDVNEKLMRIGHIHDEIVSGNMHIHLGENYCLEIYITEGSTQRVLDFIARIRTMRGIEQVKYTMVPLTEEQNER